MPQQLRSSSVAHTAKHPPISSRFSDMFLSVLDVFKIGIGPSSSHTMGPMIAAARFLDDLRGGVEKIPGAGTLDRLTARLTGSLAFTGKGHATDRAVILGFCGLTP